MSTERKIFWAFAWLALLIVGVHTALDRVHIVVIRLELPEIPAPMPRRSAAKTGAPTKSFLPYPPPGVLTASGVSPTSDAALTMRQSCRAEENFGNKSMHEAATRRHAHAPGSRMAVSLDQESRPHV